MKTLLLFLALTAPMLAQDQTIQTRNEYQTLLPAQDTTVHRSVVIDTFLRAPWYKCDVRIVTPAGRVVGWVSDVTREPIIQRDSVLTTGCPVCGSDSVVCRFVPEQIFTATPARIVWDFVEVGSSGAGYDTSRYVPAEPERVIPAHSVCGEFVDWGQTRYVCAFCGTVYHGRRK